MPEAPKPLPSAPENRVETNEREKQLDPAAKEAAEARQETTQESTEAQENLIQEVELKDAENDLENAPQDPGTKPETMPKAQEKIESFTEKIEAGTGKFMKKLEGWMPSLESLGKAFESVMILWNDAMNKFKFATSTMRMNMPSLFGGQIDQLIETYAVIKSTDPALPFLTKGDDAMQTKKLLNLKPANESKDVFMDRVLKSAQSKNKDEPWTMKQLVEMATAEVPKPTPAAAPVQPVAPNVPPTQTGTVPNPPAQNS